MEFVTKAVLLTILAVCCLNVKAEEGEERRDAEFKRIGKVPQKEKFLIASYSTVTFTALSTFTTIVPFVCLLTTQASTCSGRARARRRAIAMKTKLAIDPSIELEATDVDILTPGPVGEVSPQEKFFFTVWNTSTSTATVTSVSTNYSITVSLSAACTFPAFTSVPRC